MTRNPDPAAPGIRLCGTHGIAQSVLFDADIALGAAEWTCLLGPSGVGKSTVLRLIAGLDTGGAFDGTITASDAAPIEGRLGYMAQSDLLMPWLSVMDNVVIGAKLRGEAPDHARARSLLDRVGLRAHADKTPAALSGGMRQRAALARVLMEDRPIVLLDEPFSALDAGTRADMQELAAEVLHGKTVLLVTHDPAEAARLGHQILVMSAQEATPWPAPSTPPIRAIEAPDTLACQSALLAHLREVQAA
ncbi:ABC transporter ATP-binding protein [Thalassobacter stenotrophicus]|uniref:Aliphatic sulfonates import ATP-binding protein SsuB n=2 Tax=Thalassobacter stenotrophicus TaxID=266809 RepID=A0A0N7LTC1_9RHOB|nr:ABC transporter ATP-binding protein [Thalassobacter stenotrophicus]PVZ47496.1 ABC transporter ATP-binding protein [Thalassobacter stenotrophicus]CUH60282.1 Aliphatic sulfonates import ATP-binding protein SsuB [Thalassobacter stenotrophicus]SHI71841.1 putative hydroxymethylpyrimidine transport system ATP-binding protein [Thalassobacter stenotrophicus DSM 16310]